MPWNPDEGLTYEEWARQQQLANGYQPSGPVPTLPGGSVQYTPTPPPAMAPGPTPIDTTGGPELRPGYTGGPLPGQLAPGQGPSILGAPSQTPNQPPGPTAAGPITGGPPGTTTTTGTPAGATGGQPYNPAAPGMYGLNEGPMIDGEQVGPSEIPSINLPPPTEISPTLPWAYQQQYIDFMHNLAAETSGQYGYETPQAEAAQIDTGNIPQPNAQQQAISPEVARMLSGEGFNPATLAQMHAGATESVAGAGRTELSQSKRALEQAGLSDSPAGAAFAGDVARRTGDAQVAANRDVDLANAQAGMENFRSGVGIQTGIGAGNMAAANAMALSNANRLFEAFSQNMQAQQQTNLSNTGAQQQQLGNRAGAVSNLLGNSSNIFQSGATEHAANASTQNSNNMTNYQLNQAQLERQRQLTHFNALENRWAASLPGWGGGGTGGVPSNTEQGFNPLISAG